MEQRDQAEALGVVLGRVENGQGDRGNEGITAICTMVTLLGGGWGEGAGPASLQPTH